MLFRQVIPTVEVRSSKLEIHISQCHLPLYMYKSISNQITRHSSDHSIQLVDEFGLHMLIPLYAMSDCKLDWIKFYYSIWVTHADKIKTKCMSFQFWSHLFSCRCPFFENDIPKQIRQYNYYSCMKINDCY